MASNYISSGPELSQLYLCDYPYPAGTVLKPAGNAPFELTQCVIPYDSQAIGIVSTNPGILTNVDADLTTRGGGTYLPVTTNGRTIALVQGPCFPGDLLVPGTVAGTLMSLNQNPPTINNAAGVPPSVIAKALDTVASTAVASIKVVIQPGTFAPQGNVILKNETVTGTSTIGSIVTTNGVFWANGVPLATGSFITTQSFNGSQNQLAAQFVNSAQVTTVANAASSGTVNFYVSNQSVLYFTGNATNNWDLNVLGSNTYSYSSTPTVRFEGIISGYQMTVLSVASGSGTLANGYSISGAGVTSGTVIQEQVSGSTGGVGVYNLNNWSSTPPKLYTIGSGNVVIPNNTVTNGAALYAYAPTATSGTSLDQLMKPGQTIAIQFMNTNGASGKFMKSLQIDGVAQAVNWLGGSKPGYGTSNGIDTYTLQITKTPFTQIVTPPTRIPVYTVLGSYASYSVPVVVAQSGGGPSVSTWSVGINSSDTKLTFKYGSTLVATLDSSGNWITAGNETAYGTP